MLYIFLSWHHLDIRQIINERIMLQILFIDFDNNVIIGYSTEKNPWNLISKQVGLYIPGTVMTITWDCSNTGENQ